VNPAAAGWFGPVDRRQRMRESAWQKKRPQRRGRQTVTSSTSFEAMGDSQSHRIRSSVRNFCARQRCIRIDFKGDRDQRQYKNDNQGSHGPACSGEMRQDQPKKPAENGSFIAGTCKTRQA
jgi:hypothetical protein